MRYILLIISLASPFLSMSQCDEGEYLLTLTTTTGEYGFDFLSNGFKARGTGGGTNANNGNYIYMAFAEAPLVGSNNVPATAR